MKTRSNRSLDQRFVEPNLQLQLILELGDQQPNDSPHLPAPYSRQTHVEDALPGGSAYSHIGKRLLNEDKVSRQLTKFDSYHTNDYCLFAIYDGHGTDKVSIHLQQRMLPLLAQLLASGLEFAQAICQCTFPRYQGFAQLEKQAIALQNFAETCIGGSTVLICLVTDGIIRTANLGDSKALVVTPDGRFRWLNRIHTLADPEEYKNVLQRGGTVIHRGNSFRLSGELTLSRSLGDSRFKPFVNSSPEIFSDKYEKGSLLVMASDGFWDQCDPSQLLKIVSCYPLSPAKDLYRRLEIKPRDNATIICVRLAH